MWKQRNEEEKEKERWKRKDHAILVEARADVHGMSDPSDEVSVLIS